MPLAREVSANQLVPLALKLAETLGAERFDATTYQPSRLMYAPSRSMDAPYDLVECGGNPLNPYEWLALYPDWRDASCWPLPGCGARSRAAQAPDPRGKAGTVGVLPRAHSVEEAIEGFLADVYEPVGEGRWTYTGGSSLRGRSRLRGAVAPLQPRHRPRRRPALQRLRPGADPPLRRAGRRRQARHAGGVASVEQGDARVGGGPGGRLARARARRRRLGPRRLPGRAPGSRRQLEEGPGEGSPYRGRAVERRQHRAGAGP
ncbi:MAG: hypothetical protein V8S24_07190 [Gordonibacter pamelaeae]